MGQNSSPRIDVTSFNAEKPKSVPLYKNPFTILAVLVLVVVGVFVYTKGAGTYIKPGGPSISGIDLPGAESRIEAFISSEDFENYLSKTETPSNYRAGSNMKSFAVDEMGSLTAGVGLNAPLAFGALPDSQAGRVSETNVQVVGIDEPDIVKTDGQNIFFSSIRNNYTEPIILGDEQAVGTSRTAPFIRSGIKVVDAFPYSDLSQIGFIDKSGDLLLDSNMLVVFSGQDITGFDVTDPKLPRQNWELVLDRGTSIVSSRMYDDDLYIVASKLIDRFDLCPILLTPENSTREISVPCTSIYHPVVPISTDSTYTVFKVDPKNGNIAETVSFVAPQGRTTVYMSENGVYLAYGYSESTVSILMDFFLNEVSDLLPNDVVKRLKEIDGYNISDNSKMQEATIVIEKYQSSLKDDEQNDVEDKIEDAMQVYAKRRSRDFEKTGIAKFALPGLQVEATGVVSGSVLNQFSIDEYDGHLRLATTIGGNSLIGDFNESFNDIYVLDKDLDEVGRIEDLGFTERIYSARFIGDKGYLVTFRQIDPFYVLDLSDSANPQRVGELKIPGFSSYLHPINGDMVLGVGREGSSVKASLFDVSLPTLPKEVSNLQLDHTWSDIQNTHHAFLLDDKHKIFFLPTSKGGYVIGYDGNELKILKEVNDVRAKRALFLDDYLYVVGDNKIVVLDENTWEQVNELVFTN